MDIKNQKTLLILLSGIVGLIFIWSLINPKDYFVWFLEVVPAIIGIAVLAFTYKRFPFTNIIYIFVALHAIVLIVGGHYTYAENPLFDWFKEIFSLDRNYYDRLGHFVQGFFPALIIREFLLRKTKLERGKMLFFIVVSVALAISASYEILEWWSALGVDPEAGTAFLGTQGDIWDAQWDMFLALIGASLSQLLFSGIHDVQLKELLRRKQQ